MPRSATRTVVALLVAIGVLATGEGLAQEPRPAAAQVADILARCPTETAALRDRLAGEILGLGEDGIAEIARRLAPAGTGNDVSARFALGAVAAYASRFGAERDRAATETALVHALVAASDPEVKTFLLGQLRLVSREEAVRAAAAYLRDATLSEPAAQLMLSAGNAEARRALSAALRGATGSAQVTIVKALGELEVEEANAAILPLADAPGLPLRKAALAALANIGSPASSSVLTRAAKEVDYAYEASNATGALLAYARKLGRKGHLDACDRTCRAIIKTCRDEQQLPVSSAALAILADTFGYEALPYLLRASEHKDHAYRMSALNLAERIFGVAATRRWIATAQQSSPAARADIIGMLGRRGDTTVLPFLESSLRAREPDVRMAAAESLARIKKADAAADLLRMLGSSEGDEAQGIASVLSWILDERHLDPLASMLDTLAPAPRAAAIAVIAGKGARRYFEKILVLTSDQDPGVRRAAFAALKDLAGPEDLGALLRLLESTGDPASVKDLQQAFVRAANQAEPAQGRARPLLDAMNTSGRPVEILAVLPQVGGAEALSAVIEQFDRPDAVRKAAAFRALVQWPDPTAAQKLFTILAAGDGEYRSMAFGGFLRQVASSSLPADQKLLQYRKIIGFASDAGERRSVIRAIGQLKTFQSFMAVARYLDDPEIRNEAAASAMRIALPSSSGGLDGLSGTIVREGLNKVLQVLIGPASESDRESLRDYLATTPGGDGFVPLFNGRDLSGWQGLVGNPVSRAKMSPAELAAKQAEANERARSMWAARDGSIVFSGKGDNLCTVRDYGDVELLVDWRITTDGDSGIYLRGSPQVQIWDPARTDVGAEVGSGGLYNNQKNASRPLVRADNPVGEWNTLRITMVGEMVTVFLNGVKVVDNVTMENYWDRTQPIFPRGPIELQAHGTDLAFRDIYVREIPERNVNLTSEEIADAFVALFNGRDLRGWVGNTAGYKVVDGALVFEPAAGGGNLYSANEYADFQLRFEFQLTPGANSGIGIRAPLEGDAAYAGMEIQILDDAASMYANLRPYQYHGSVYGVIPARRGALKPAGEWNTEEITVNRSHIRVVVNGIVVVDGDVIEASRDGAMDRNAHPGLQRLSGHIGLLSHDTVVRFRNIRITELSK